MGILLQPGMYTLWLQYYHITYRSNTKGSTNIADIQDP
jgi:hypothetical protein